jgi:hypothetical protein
MKLLLLHRLVIVCVHPLLLALVEVLSGRLLLVQVIKYASQSHLALLVAFSQWLQLCQQIESATCASKARLIKPLTLRARRVVKERMSLLALLAPALCMTARQALQTLICHQPQNVFHVNWEPHTNLYRERLLVFLFLIVQPGNMSLQFHP